MTNSGRIPLKLLAAVTVSLTLALPGLAQRVGAEVRAKPAHPTPKKAQARRKTSVTPSVPSINYIGTFAGNGVAGYSGDGNSAKQAELHTPGGVALDSSSDLYIADSSNNVIRMVDGPTTAEPGFIFTLAGNGSDGHSGDGGPASQAQLNSPSALAVDGNSNVYIADTSNFVVRGVYRGQGNLGYLSGSSLISGDIYPLAGNFSLGSGYSGDGGPATQAQLSFVYGIALDTVGNLYISDFNNNRIREVNTSGIISTFAGTGTQGHGGDGGPATQAQLNLPQGIAFDSQNNLIISEYGNNDVRVVSASTGLITTVAGNGTGGYIGDGGPATSAELNNPNGVAVDASGNIFIADYGNNVIRYVDALSGIITTIAGNGVPGYSGDGGLATQARLSGPVGVVVDANGQFYVGDSNNNVVRFASSAVQFLPATPCRVVDTRNADGPFGGPAISAGTARSFTIPAGPCAGIPASAFAYSLNVTVVPPGPLGYLTIWPTGATQPVASTLNSPDGRIKANAAIVPAGTAGGVSVFASNTTNVVLDINGYFTAPGSNTLQFYPLTPCRVADTRRAVGPLGGPSLAADTERDFPVLSSSCAIPSTAQAYSMNFTAVPPDGAALGYLTVWDQGGSRPVVSTLNDLTGTVVANAAIVPAGSSGGVAVYPNNLTDFVIDINGYFAAAGSGYNLHPISPCRSLDTRTTSGAFSGELSVDVIASAACAPPVSAEAFVFNATAVPEGELGYLTLWPDSESQPVVSTLNALDGTITSNMAIVVNVDGSVDAFNSGTSNLVLDLTAYFAP
ncbi:MAG: hypothetical protein ABSD20_04190 [Terriglobales bacterium]